MNRRDVTLGGRASDARHPFGASPGPEAVGVRRVRPADWAAAETGLNLNNGYITAAAT